jgi:hypothetical protein
MLLLLLLLLLLPIELNLLLVTPTMCVLLPLQMLEASTLWLVQPP